MSYQLTVKDGVIHFTLTGRLTNRDLEAGAAEVLNYERGAVVPHRITDMTGITELDIRYPAVMEMAAQRKQITFRNSFKSAIIAREPQHVGYARMFQTLNDNPQITIQIFPDEQSAKAWIAGETVLREREAVAAR